MEMTHEERHTIEVSSPRSLNFQAMPDVLKIHYQLLYAAEVLQY